MSDDKITMLGNGGYNQIEISEFSGFHFMLPVDAFGQDDLEISVEYKILPDSIFFVAWLRTITEGPALGVRYMVHAAKIPPCPQDEIIDKLVEQLNNSDDFHNSVEDVLNGDALAQQ